MILNGCTFIPGFMVMMLESVKTKELCKKIFNPISSEEETYTVEQMKGFDRFVIMLKFSV